MGAAAIVNAQADAMRTAAGNSAGAMTGFMGMGMAMNQGGMNAHNLYAVGQQQAQAAQNQADSWNCSCGTVATGNFCPNCGAKKPAPAGSWTCSCGTVATGNFCPNCGAKKPDSDTWTCSCGATVTGNFCPNCGAKRP